MSLWNKLKNARRPGSGNYWNPGRYLMSVAKVNQDKARDGIEFLAIEGTCVKVLVQMDGTMIKYEGKTTERDSNKVGETVSQVIKFKADILDTALGNAKSFVCGVLDLSDEDINEMSDEEFDETMDEITGGDGANLAGSYVVVNAVVVVKKNGDDFVKVTYEHPEPDMLTGLEEAA